jgi:16S rRNA (guanine966-N2)-methyltransferase
LHITGGQAKGIRLDVLPGERTRPTTDRVRESVFGSLAAFLPEARVLDLYAGSGALGLEAASRGAASVTLVESHPPTAHLLKKNAAKLRPAGVECDIQVLTRKAELFLAAPPQAYDLILIDPPYAFYQKEGVIPALWTALSEPGWLSGEGLVVIEHPKRTDPGCGEGWAELKRKDYGGTLVSFLEKANIEH